MNAVLPEGLPEGRRGSVPMPATWRPELDTAVDARFRVRYEIVGSEGAPLLVVAGGISANRHVCANALDPSPGWWRKLVGPSLAIDTDRWQVLGFDFLGSPGTVEPPRRLHVTPGDQADAVVALLDHLGVRRVHRVLGASYGGMVALALGCRQPARADGVVLIGAAHRGHAQATGVRSVQRRVVEFAIRQGRSHEGVALARALAFTTYKSAEGLDARFPFDWEWEDGTPVHAIDRFLRKRGDEFAERFDAETYLTLSASIDLCELRPEDLAVPAWFIGWEEDTLVPSWLITETARRAGAPAGLCLLRSEAGHDAFLLHSPAYEVALRETLPATEPRHLASSAG